MDVLKIQLVQTDISWENTSENLTHISKMLKSGAGEANIILLPEMFNTGFSMKIHELAEQSNGRTISWMKQIACDMHALVVGSLMFCDNGAYFNRLIVHGPDGILLQYNKRHLFSMGNEHNFFTRGNELPSILEFRGWKIMPLICYDIRFPVWSRNSSGYDLLIYLANWPAGRTTVWETLLKARAIENQCFVAGVNRVGMDGNKIQYSGSSMVVDPRGIPLAAPADGERLVSHTISLEYLHKFRKKFPVLSDRDDFTVVL
jgi:omega-amidase